VAEIIVESAELFDSKAEVEREVLGGFPVILSEEREIVGAVLVIENAATTEAAIGRTDEKFLEVGFAGSGIDEEKLAVEDLGKLLVEIDARVFTAETKDVSAFDPADGVYEVVVVLCLELVGRRSGADLEAGAEESELVDGLRDVVGGAVDAEVINGDG